MELEELQLLLVELNKEVRERHCDPASTPVYVYVDETAQARKLLDVERRETPDGQCILVFLGNVA